MGIIREPCPHGLTPSASTAVMLAISDALALTLMELKGFQWRGLRSAPSWRLSGVAAARRQRMNATGRRDKTSKEIDDLDRHWHTRFMRRRI